MGVVRGSIPRESIAGGSIPPVPLFFNFCSPIVFIKISGLVYFFDWSSWGVYCGWIGGEQLFFFVLHLGCCDLERVSIITSLVELIMNRRVDCACSKKPHSSSDSDILTGELCCGCST
ncbi:hypothetical protein F4860DRAFT_116437 [Xylaria cubensis]|nr:hypothetical protein F4860DRAFT_116437 [Xylaria cubensis]